MGEPKLEWMYRNSSEVVDKEEYLLGKPVDKAFEQSTFGNEIEKDCLPSSIFANTSSNIQVDVLRKLKEDPLEIIRQKEIERRKQLLKNPVKLKKLQNMLKDKQQKHDGADNDKLRNKKKASDDSEDIDGLLTSKYLSLMKKHGIKSLSDLADLKVDKKKKKKKEHKSKSRKYESSENETDEEDKPKKQKKVADRRSDDSSDSSDDTDKEYEKKSKHSRRKYRELSYHDSDSGKQKKQLKIYRSKSPSPKRNQTDYKGSKYKENGNRDSKDCRYRPREREFHKRQDSRFHYKDKKAGLSEEDKQKRLQEMMENAKWRDEVRVENVARYKKEELSEINEKEYKEDFLRKQMSIATSSGTVESRIKSNINSIQRSKFSMNENFARR